MVKEVTRCTGECCQAFQLMGLTPADIEKKIKERKEWAEKEDCYDKPRILEEIFFMEALIPIGKPNRDLFISREERAIRGDKWKDNPKFEKWLDREEAKITAILQNEHYKCKYFDPQNKVCTVYETRPYICKEYPPAENPDGCIYKNCTRTIEIVEDVKAEVESEA